MIGRTIIGWAP